MDISRERPFLLFFLMSQVGGEFFSFDLSLCHSSFQHERKRDRSNPNSYPVSFYVKVVHVLLHQKFKNERILGGKLFAF